MKTSADYARELMIRRGLRTPYALAKHLGISKQAALNWFNRGGTFSDETALKIADELEIDPAIIFADLSIERADPAQRAIWERVAQYVRGATAAALLAFVALPSPSGHVFDLGNTRLIYSSEACILCQIARAAGRAAKALILRLFGCMFPGCQRGTLAPA